MSAEPKGAAASADGRAVLAKNERRMVRKPATKYANLRTKLQKGKLQTRPARKR